MQSTALIAETSCQQLSPPKQAVDRFNSLCKVLASLTTKPTLTSNLLHHRHRHGFCHESHELILCKIFSGLHKFVNNWLYDNLTPRTIWRFGQFDTIRANRTIWHQEGKEDNLTPWHIGQQCISVFLGQTVAKRSNMFLCVGPVGPGFGIGSLYRIIFSQKDR